MPLRLSPLSPPSIARLRQGFHTSAILRDASPQPNHYETLQIPTNASPSEVKKSFYALSKTHHPDLNPTDPHASQRFVQISNAYATLSSPTKRSHYDSQILPYSRPSSSSHRHQASPHGSYSSSNPAGGRPASGLSRRRAQFRGPPPSFYRSGGWGEHSAKRRSARDSSSGLGGAASGAGETSSSQDYNGGGNANARPGMGHGQGMFGEEVRHFDREEHLRTHENHDRRFRQRDRSRNRRGDGWGAVDEGQPGGTLGNFLWVGGVIVLAVSVPMMLAGRVMGDGKKRRVEGK